MSLQITTFALNSLPDAVSLWICHSEERALYEPAATVAVFLQRHMLQLVLQPRPHLHQLVPMPQQLPRVAHRHGRHRQLGKASLHQQLQRA